VTGPASGASYPKPLREIPEQRAPLRLTVTRGALGLELYLPIELGPLEVSELALALPGLKFPVDLSGGVPAFRHRRGDLERVLLRADLSAVGRFLATRLSDVVGRLERAPALWSSPGTLCVGLLGSLGALAFDLIWAPEDGDARFVVARARGAGLPAPALGFALRACDSVFGKLFAREGRVLRMTDAAAELGRELLPPLGVRAPSALRAHFGSLEVEDGVASLELDATLPPAALSAAAARALELALLVTDSDDALAAGDVERARSGYLAALEHAPRHPELSLLVAESDLSLNAGPEAPLALVGEALAPTQAGWVGAELLARAGDPDAAREALIDAARAERFAPLAALWWVRLAEVQADPPTRMAALDEAVARAPALQAARWKRFEARVERGDPEAALADAEHIEAAATGARERHEVCRRAARRLLDAGYVREAGARFERALRYLPDDIASTAGLARALMEAGRPERAVALLERAIALGERQGRADADALVDLAVLLADRLGDRPQAIARVRQVSASSPRAIDARALEARWRAALGDIAGASLAFARMREAVELATNPPVSCADFLVEAASFEREVRRDAASAERHLAVALRLRPRDQRIGDAYRAAAALVAELARKT
jgi:tetratricopeptide (TPR) repeat protein